MCHRRSPDYSGNTYLGLHLGTDKFRALILDANLKAIYFSQVRYDVDLPEYGTKYGTVTDGGPMEFLACPVMWVKALDMLLNSLESQGADMHSIVAVSAAGQHHGCVFWSDLGLRRLCNLNPHLRLHEQLPESAFELIRSPTWRDTSTDKEVLEMTQAVGGSLEMAAITGSRTYARFTGPQIRKVFKQCPEHYERTPRISLLSSFVTSLLIGGMAAISVCDASGMNLLDLGQNKWSQKCLDACAPDLARRLRKPVASSQLQGHIADYYVKRWNFRPDCMVLSGTGSKGAELAGVLVEKDFIVISLDVSDTITMPLTKAPHLEEGHVMRHATRPDQFMGLLCFRNGLVARTIICEEVAKGNFDQFYAMLDATPKGNGGNLAVHFYDREILPISKGVLRWDPTMDNQQQECLRGVPSFETPEMEVRALLEGQIIHHCAISREMGFGPDPNTKVIVVGNDAKYHNLLQIVADVFNTPVYKRSGPEVCLLGSAFRARYAFYEHRERPCNCRACRRRGCREPKLSFHEFFRNVPSGLTLAAEPDPDSAKTYAPLFGRISQMCQLLGAQGAQFLDSKMNL
ncbi:xylulose kinase [Drosophila kikkawai]|uniref:Xylulose kinase n=1 Tax=Drosophila kikkawai TaxID=30033 RepID=A0A6P4J2Z7_DROKI|nr:xylulose kinase [Drosophila kikkawai]